MNCPNCLLVEMTVDKIEGDTIFFVCRKCGEEVQKNIHDIEPQEESN